MWVLKQRSSSMPYYETRVRTGLKWLIWAGLIYLANSELKLPWLKLLTWRISIMREAYSPCGRQIGPCGRQTGPCGRQTGPCGMQTGPCGRQDSLYAMSLRKTQKALVEKSCTTWQEKEIFKQANKQTQRFSTFCVYGLQCNMYKQKTRYPCCFSLQLSRCVDTFAL
jgi:hypothetical protein